MHDSNFYTIKIKKEFVHSLLEDLQKSKAIEIEPEIPEWQKKEVRKRLKEMKEHPEKSIPWEDVKAKIIKRKGYAN